MLIVSTFHGPIGLQPPAPVTTTVVPLTKEARGEEDDASATSGGSDDPAQQCLGGQPLRLFGLGRDRARRDPQTRTSGASARASSA